MPKTEFSRISSVEAPGMPNSFRLKPIFVHLHSRLKPPKLGRRGDSARKRILPEAMFSHNHPPSCNVGPGFPSRMPIATIPGHHAAQ